MAIVNRRVGKYQIRALYNSAFVRFQRSRTQNMMQVRKNTGRTKVAIQSRFDVVKRYGLETAVFPVSEPGQIEAHSKLFGMNNVRPPGIAQLIDASRELQTPSAFVMRPR